MPDSPDESAPSQKAGLAKWIKRFTIAGVVLTLLVVVAGYVLLELAKVEPEFYQEALHVDQQQQQRNGSEMEKRILDLRNSVMIADAWTATFTEDQINGWFAYDLKQKLPDLIPPEVTDPRVSIDEQSVRLAFRCSAKPFRGVAIIDADVFMTGVVNQIGVRVKSVHSGKVPVPLAVFADQISDQIKQSGIEIEWSTDENDPIAIVQIPDALIKPQSGNYIELQEIKISTGEIALSGVTHPADF